MHTCPVLAATGTQGLRQSGVPLLPSPVRQSDVPEAWQNQDFKGLVSQRKDPRDLGGASWESPILRRHTPLPQDGRLEQEEPIGETCFWISDRPLEVGTPRGWAVSVYVTPTYTNICF